MHCCSFFFFSIFFKFWCWEDFDNMWLGGCFVVNGTTQRFGNYTSTISLSSSLPMGQREHSLSRFVPDNDALSVRTVTL